MNPVTEPKRIQIPRPDGFIQLVDDPVPQQVTWGLVNVKCLSQFLHALTTTKFADRARLSPLFAVCERVRNQLSPQSETWTRHFRCDALEPNEANTDAA